MEKKTLGWTGIILGIIVAVLGWNSFPDAISGGYMSFVGYILIIIGIILLFLSNSKK
ncbi:MAG: hypothetical protein AABW80_03455 [Nanoarchaeota archaeon]